jgi:hypothetical protein
MQIKNKQIQKLKERRQQKKKAIAAKKRTKKTTITITQDLVTVPEIIDLTN